ncbi:MAG: hypothetical protein ACYC6M_11790 [Terriglobales bacterium]
MPQTSIANPTQASPGRVAQILLGESTHSYQLLDATAIAFGLAVVSDFGAHGGGTCKLPAGTGGKFLGVAMDDLKHASDQAGGPQYVTGDNPVIGDKVIAWVVIDQDVNETLPVFFRHTANGAGHAPGMFRADGDLTGGTARIQTLTLGAAGLDAGAARKQRLRLVANAGHLLEAGVPRVQTLTFNQAVVAAETIAAKVDGTSAIVVTFDVNNDNTLQQLANAIFDAGAVAKAGPGGTNSIISCEPIPVAAGDNTKERVIKIVSFPSAVSALITKPSDGTAGVDVTTAAGLTCTLATATAGILPGSLTATIDGNAVTAQWAGSNDATLAMLAKMIAGASTVGSAIVDDSVGAVGSRTDIIVTSSTNAPGTTVITLFAANNGGASVPTVEAVGGTQTVAGVAAGSLAFNFNGTAYQLPWAGSTNETLQLAADLFAQLANVASASVTEVTGADTNRVITITDKIITGAQPADLTATSPCGGVNNPTLVPAKTQAGVSAVAGNADAIPSARWLGTYTAASGLAALEIAQP